jgi:hypothetical protein
MRAGISFDKAAHSAWTIRFCSSIKGGFLGHLADILAARVALTELGRLLLAWAKWTTKAAAPSAKNSCSSIGAR